MSEIGTILVSIIVLQGLYFAWLAERQLTDIANLPKEEQKAKKLEAKGYSFRSSVLTGWRLWLLTAGILLQLLDAILEAYVNSGAISGGGG